MERKIYLLWLNASQNMNAVSGAKFHYWEGQCVAYTEALAALNGCTFIEANRALMNTYNAEENATKTEG